MGYTVKVNHPHFPEGTELNVGGIGRVPNGGSAEVDEEMERLFMLEHGRTIDEAFSNDGTVTTSGSSALDKSEVDQILALFAEETPSEEEPEPEPNLFTTPSTTEDTEEGGES